MGSENKIPIGSFFFVFFFTFPFAFQKSKFSQNSSLPSLVELSWIPSLQTSRKNPWRRFEVKLCPWHRAVPQLWLNPFQSMWLKAEGNTRSEQIIMTPFQPHKPKNRHLCKQCWSKWDDLCCLIRIYTVCYYVSDFWLACQFAIMSKSKDKRVHLKHRGERVKYINIVLCGNICLPSRWGIFLKGRLDFSEWPFR